jgi:hypothetical protein
VIGHAVEQGCDPLGVHLLRRRFLPEAFAFDAIGPHELGLHQLPRQLEQQLPLLERGEVAFEGGQLSAECGGHGVSLSLLRKGSGGAAKGSAMKCIDCHHFLAGARGGAAGRLGPALRR